MPVAEGGPAEVQGPAVVLQGRGILPEALLLYRRSNAAPNTYTIHHDIAANDAGATHRDAAAANHGSSSSDYVAATTHHSTSAHNTATTSLAVLSTAGRV